MIRPPPRSTLFPYTTLSRPPDSDPGVNLRTAESALRELGRRGCRLAVLPELWLCGYRTVTLGPDARAAAEPIDGPIQRRRSGEHTAGLPSQSKHLFRLLL